MPQPTVTISRNHSVPLHVGNELVLTANISFSKSDVDELLDILWRKGDNDINTDNRITVSNITKDGDYFIASLKISSIGISDGGQITATVTVRPMIVNEYIRTVSATASEILIITGIYLKLVQNTYKKSLTLELLSLLVRLPTPSISLITDIDTNSLYAGNNLTLSCNYTWSRKGAIQPVVKWKKRQRDITEGDTLVFSPLSTSDTGKYTCVLTVNEDLGYVTVENTEVKSEQIEVIVQSNLHNYGKCMNFYDVLISFFLICLSVPLPDVDTTPSRTAPFYVGTGLTLTCTVTLHHNVDNNEHVKISWYGPGITTHSVTYTHKPEKTYTYNLTITPLMLVHSGRFQFTVTITGKGNVMATINNSIMITVMCELSHTVF